MLHRFSRAVSLSAALAFAGASFTANGENYSHRVAQCFLEDITELRPVNATLNDVLGLLALTCGASYTPVRTRRDTMAGAIQAGTPMSILDSLSKEYKFMWMINSGELVIVNRRRQSTRLIKSQAGDISLLRRDLKKMGWLVSSDALMSSENGDMIKITGDDEFIALVELLQEANISQRTTPPKILSPVRIYRGGKG